MHSLDHDTSSDANLAALLADLLRVNFVPCEPGAALLERLEGAAVGLQWANSEMSKEEPGKHDATCWPGELLLVDRDGAPQARPVARAALPQGPQPLADALHRAAHDILAIREQCQRQQQALVDYAEQVTQDFEELSWLRDLTQKIEHCDITNPMGNVVDHVLPDLCALVGAAGMVLILEEAGQATRDVEVEPLTHAPAARLERQFHSAGQRVLTDDACLRLIDWLVSESRHRHVVRNDLAQSSRAAEFPGLNSCIIVPLATRRSAEGWLLALNRIPRVRFDAVTGAPVDCGGHGKEFGTPEVNVLGLAATLLATHSRNTKLFKENEQMLLGVIRAFVNAMDAKDAYTCGHSERVAAIGRRIGQQLGLSAQECDQLYTTGLLHDIGKIGVPDAVLGKPGRLDDEEFRRIQNHTTIGHQILKHVEPLSYVLPGMLHHHEALDGSGYPFKLAGDQIPLFARILAVADSFDAMTSSRPYRQAMPFEKAQGILRNGSGKQWDPRVLDAFFEALEDIKALCQARPADTPPPDALPTEAQVQQAASNAP
jgi:HD-GYP domain-containing protein (c-di-GMP phosphodiesterase class II)